MVKRKQNIIKKVALVATLSFLLTSAASTNTANATSPALNQLLYVNRVNDEYIKDKGYAIIELFKLIKDEIEANKNTKDKNIEELLQGQQTNNDIWGPIFLLYRLNILSEVLTFQNPEQKSQFENQELKKYIEKIQTNNDKGNSTYFDFETSVDLKIITAIRNINKEKEANDKLLLYTLKPDDDGTYIPLDNDEKRHSATVYDESLQPLINPISQEVLTRINVWFKIIKELTFKNLNEEKKAQITEIQLAYENALSKIPNNKLNRPDNTLDEETQQQLERITQIQANTIAKIMKDLGYYDAKTQIPYPEIPEMKDILKPQNEQLEADKL